MAIAANDLKRMLDDAWDDAPDGDYTLRDQLRANERAAGSLLAGGSLSSVSKNSASHSYAYGNGTLTIAEIARGWRTLIDLYDELFDSLDPNNSDAEVVIVMRQRLAPVREFTKDFTMIGCD